MTHFVDFEPVGRRGDCPEGKTLLECARLLGVDLVNVCGGGGHCASCVIQILEGEYTPITDTEQIYLAEEQVARGYRLACMTTPLSDCKVRVPAESLTTPQRAQVEGQEIPVTPQPVAQTYSLSLTPPSLKDLLSDADRVAQALSAQYGLSRVTFDHTVLGRLSTALRTQNWEAEVVVYKQEVIAALPVGSKTLGVAVDLGTTKVAMYLMDLANGETLAARGLMNPQIAFGEDIMTRMSAAQNAPESARHFQNMLVETFNSTITELCQEINQPASCIVNMVVVGNTAMHHLFLGFPVRQLGRAPYVPEVASALDVKARDLGLAIAEGAFVHLLPNVAGFVGADHVSMLLATELHRKTGVVLAIDIGTNTEICLANQGVLTSLSTASGPAFEGAHIKYGMRAAAGAIERFQILDGKYTYQTIENAPPIGLCGSGILDVLAQLYNSGILSSRGKMGEHPAVRGVGKDREFIITSQEEEGNEVTFSQADVEQLQLAKGAIRAGINILLSSQGMTMEDIDEVIIAGAFGTYLDVNSAIAIGMLPDVDRTKVSQVGNAAGVGAKQALISQEKREEAQTVAAQVKYIELAGYPDFMKVFSKAMSLG